MLILLAVAFAAPLLEEISVGVRPLLVALEIVLSRNWRRNLLNTGKTGGGCSDITVWPPDIVPGQVDVLPGRPCFQSTIAATPELRPIVRCCWFS